MKKYKHTNIVKSGKELVEGGNMKRVFGIVAIIIVVYAIYFDITAGTLPGAEKKNLCKKLLCLFNMSNWR